MQPSVQTYIRRKQVAVWYQLIGNFCRREILLKTRDGEANEQRRSFDIFQRLVRYLELIDEAMAEPGAPIVGSEKRSLLVEVNDRTILFRPVSLCLDDFTSLDE